MTAIELSNVRFQKDGREILDGIDLRIESGTLAVVVGPSGSGKSTLLRLIAGLERPSSGSVTVGGVAVDGSPPPRLAMVFEDDGLYEHLDVSSQLEFPSRIQRLAPSRGRELARTAARLMRVSRLWTRDTSTLSSGERNIVAVARAVARDELGVLLMDEPLSHADAHVRRRFRLDVRELHARGNVTMVVATNDQSDAMAMADLLVVLIDGAVAQEGAPMDVFDSPSTTQVASFIGPLPMNLFPATWVQEGGAFWLSIGSDRIRLDSARGVTHGQAVIVGVHAHELVRARPGTPFGRTFRGTVSQVHDLGSATHIRFGLGSAPAGTFVMTENRPAAVRPGDRLELTWVPGRLRLFAADTGRAIPM